MRYLFAFLVVALMASAAMAACPSDAIGPVDDTQLPVSGAEKSLNPVQCRYVDWDFYFTRENVSSGRTKVFAAITNTTMLESIDSQIITDPDSYHRDGTATITASPIQAKMYLDNEYDDTGHWTGLQLEYQARY